MGELGLNKIFGAILATVLVIFALKEVTYIVFPSGDGHGGHHGEEHEMSLNEQIAERYAYYVEVAEGGGAAVVEEVFDLGLALASADPALGERAFRGKCVTCHTIEEGGANGTGPNLYGIMSAQKHAVPGFTYSNAMTQLEGPWTYENMSEWLENPAGYVRGTSMAFAGLRRDDERANVIAYLASYTPDAPAFPDPLPAETDVAEETGEAVEAEVAIAAGDAPALATGEVETLEAVDGTAPVADDAVETELVPGVVADAVDESVDAVEEATEAVTEEATDAVEEATEEAEAPSEE